MKGPWRALFYQGSPEISLAGSNFGSIWGSMRVHEGPLSPDRVPKKCSKMIMYNVEMVYIPLYRLENYRVLDCLL